MKPKGQDDELVGVGQGSVQEEAMTKEEKDYLSSRVERWRKKAMKMRARAGLRSADLADARAEGYEACADSLELALQQLSKTCSTD